MTTQLPPGGPARPATATSRLSTPSGPPSPQDIAWVAAIALTKAAIVALAVDAFVNADRPRFRGKAMRLRAIGYAGGLLAVPIVWRLRAARAAASGNESSAAAGGPGPSRGAASSDPPAGGATAPRPEPIPYPRELDLAVALPLLVDAAGNAAGIYQRAHVDDAIHFANTALGTAVVGALITPRTRTAWEAAGIATLGGVAGSAVWEIVEWTAMKLGASGMDLTYDDTMADLIEGSSGALLGGVITLLRHPTRLRQVPGREADPLLRPGAGSVD